MTYEQYWDGDVWMVKQYREAERLRQERLNNEAWLKGAYVYDAILRVSPILHAFAKKGTKPQPYLKKPYDIGTGKKVNVEDAQEKENERLRATLFFKNWARAAQKKFHA